MASFEYTYFLVDPDLWHMAQVDLHSCQYYSYILWCAADILFIRHDVVYVLPRNDNFMKLTPNSIGKPDIYLGAKLKHVHLDNDVWMWVLILVKFAQETVRNHKKQLK